MTGQMKQRIVGIVVLVFLALILLPWLFANKPTNLFEENNAHKKEKPISNGLPEMLQESSDFSSKPIPDKIDDLPKSPKPITSDFQAAKQVAPEPKKPDQNATRVSELNANQIVKIENSIVHSNKDVEEDLIELAKPVAKKITVAKVKPKPINKATTLKSVGKASEKSWNIQLGSFSNKNNATKLVQQLKSKGYDAHIKISKDSSGKSMSKVFVVQSGHESAESAVKQIDKLFKVHGVIMKVTA